MKLEIDPRHWALAKNHFLQNPEKKIYIPTEETIYFFIKAKENQIFALAKRKHRSPYILGMGVFGTVVTVQDEAEILYACKLVDDPEPQLTSETTLYQILQDIKHKRMPDLTPLQKDMIALKCCFAVLACHQERIIHGNINPHDIRVHFIEDNIFVLLNAHEPFHLLPQGQETILLRTLKTPIFPAPETYYNHFSFESDLYALGQIFRLLNRKTWSKNLIDDLPENRFTLHEMMYLISQSLSVPPNSLPPVFQNTYKQAKLLVLRHFIEKLETGIPLGNLIKCSIFSVFFYELKTDLLFLYCCQAFHRAFLENPWARIYGCNNFIVMKQNEKISVTFNDGFTILDKEIQPLAQEPSEDPEKSAVYSLGKILDLLGRPSINATHPEPADRPRLLILMYNLLDGARKIHGNGERHGNFFAELHEIQDYLNQAQRPTPAVPAPAEDRLVSPDPTSDDLIQLFLNFSIEEEPPRFLPLLNDFCNATATSALPRSDDNTSTATDKRKHLSF